MSTIRYFTINVDGYSNAISFDCAESTAFAAAEKLAAKTGKRVWLKEYRAYKNVKGSDRVEIGKSYYVLPDGTYSSKDADRIHEMQEEEEEEAFLVEFLVEEYGRQMKGVL